MAENIFDRISLISQHATKQDRAIIDCLHANNIGNLSYLSITEFAGLAGVAESTLLRFCRKLGLRGYSEFRMLLAQSKSEYTGDEQDFAFTIMKSMTAALRSTYEMIDHADVDKAVGILCGAERIYCFGSGNSGVAAEELRNKLLRFGVHAFHFTDSHFQAIAAATLHEKDVLVLFSVSGSTKDMLAIAKAAKQSRAKLIVVTNYLRSPLGAYADILLSVVAKSTPLDGGSLVAKVSQLYVIDVLAAAYFKRTEEISQRNLERTAVAVLDKEV